jgi:hypothetical protein
LLEGETVNLRVAEREDADYLVECVNGINWGEYVGISEQTTKSQVLGYFDNPSNYTILTETKWFIVQKKDGTKIGLMNHRSILPNCGIEISYELIPNA